MATPDPGSDREALVGAASSLYYEHGIQAVGMDAVRAAAGVPLKRLYRTFRSKDDLIEATLRERDAAILTSVRQYVDERRPAGAEEAVLAVFDWMSSWFAEETFRGCAFINAFGELGDDAPRVATAVRDHKRAFRSALAELVSGLELPPERAEALTEQLYIVANGAMATAPITGSPQTALDAKAIARALIAGARREPA
ncbi:TetR/AcrR family transcriptional regulator [Georgenia daeguensis]|uniref:TetR/AcrR family transcriptional regulator n=1 Tax=Georgenia daeguensis TaxID=908355 RepID=A0ABP8EP95_9MICO